MGKNPYRMLFADEQGVLYDHPALRAAGRSGDRYVELMDEDLVELPTGASLTMIPGGVPVGLTAAGQFAPLDPFPGKNGRVWAVGALLPQGYTRTWLPAYIKDEAGPLPLLGYTAVACRNGTMYGAIQPTDDPTPWDPTYFDTADLNNKVGRFIAKRRDNRLLQHLAHCALAYHCFTAQNIFYRRWEGGIPVSPSCNAACLGCISQQPADCCPSPQNRIGFRPTLKEVLEIALPHLEEGGKDAMVSFGQGCEGEPALEAEIISAAIAQIRQITKSGTINMNTNGGYTRGIETICATGLDALRVSFISARQDTFQAYYRPRGYTLQDVSRSIKTAVANGVYVSLNLLTLPGFTDRPEETAALVDFLQETGVHMVQLRNLNIDPDWLQTHLPNTSQPPLGIDQLIITLKKLPGLRLGNYSRRKSIR